MTACWRKLRWMTRAGALFAPAICLSWANAIESRAYLVTREHSNSLASAVDARGVLHRGKPWINDRTNSVAPAYPFSDRLHRHQGTGVIRLTLDLKTGTVRQVSVVKSTGFRTLDACAMSAFRQWRWRPGKWKEINLPVTFRLSNPSAPLPKDAAPLPAATR
jgi:TonB family protein